MGDFRKELDDVMKNASERVKDVSNSGGFVPHLRVTGRVTVETLFDKLVDLNKYIKVDFDENGEIPEYIEFDRDDKDMLAIVEETLTLFINCDKPYNSKEHKNDDEDKKYILTFSSDMFNGHIDDTKINLKYMFNQACKDDEILKMIKEIDEYLLSSKETLLEYLDDNKSLEELNGLHSLRIASVEDMSLSLKNRYNDLINQCLDAIFKSLMEDVKDNIKYKLLICNDMVDFKNRAHNYINAYVDERCGGIMEVLRAEFYKIKVLFDINNLL